MTTRALRLRVYLELLLRLRRKQRTRDRIQFLKQNPDAINEQDFDMLAETSPAGCCKHDQRRSMPLAQLRDS